MPQPETISLDIAAVVIMLITLMSLLFRRITSGPTARVYLTAMVLVLVTAVICLATDVPVPPMPYEAHGAFMLVYYALRSLTAPMYLILIATVSSTTHRMNATAAIGIALSAPMLVVLALILTNPAHHLIFTYTVALERGPLFIALYLSAAYYSLIGIAWLVRWRKVLNSDEFATLMMLYPIVLASVAIEFTIPWLHIEMFFISIAMMMISAFVIRPEKTLDSLVEAASLQAYREMCHRAFLTGKPLCLVFLEIVNLEKLRQLIGKDELQTLVQRVSLGLARTLARDDVLYYLRNGLFCIAPRRTDPARALAVAQRTHEQGKARSLQRHERAPQTMMRVCVVNVPGDVSSNEVLRAFVRRFAHLMPESHVATYAELARQPGFDVQIALSDIVARAIRERSFEMHYQPIYHVASGSFRSAEALIRLHDAEFGWVSPGLFIPESEQSGTILDIATIQLERTMEFLAKIDFDGIGLDYIEVNLSIEQCVRPELAPELLSMLQRHGVSPGNLNFEITETSGAFSHEVVNDNIRTLTAAGASFSLDDYGTGYSNVVRAIDLPFPLIKFDKTFTDRLDDPAVRTVLADSVAMMRSLGKQTLAEGVETPEQAATLISIGLDYLQGYHFAMPLPEDEFLAFLAKQQLGPTR